MAERDRREELRSLRFLLSTDGAVAAVESIPTVEASLNGAADVFGEKDTVDIVVYNASSGGINNLDGRSDLFFFALFGVAATRPKLDGECPK